MAILEGLPSGERNGLLNASGGYRTLMSLLVKLGAMVVAVVLLVAGWKTWSYIQTPEGRDAAG